MRRITVGSQLVQTVARPYVKKHLHKKGLVEWPKV
jgi:hypothetical protein